MVALLLLREEVSNLFVVYFQIRAPDEELLLLVLGVVEVAEDVVESVRNYALLVLLGLYADHCVCFTAAGLPVGKNGAVVALHDALDQWEGALVVDLPLR